MSRTLLDELMRKHKPDPDGTWDDDTVARVATEYAERVNDLYTDLSIAALLEEDEDEFPIDEYYN